MPLSPLNIRDVLRQRAAATAADRTNGYAQNRVTLAFSNPQMEKSFRAYLAPSAVQQTRRGALALGGILMVIWVWLKFVAPSFFEISAAIHEELALWTTFLVWVGIPYVIALYLLSGTRLAEKFYELGAASIYVVSVASCCAILDSAATEIARYYSVVYMVLMTFAIYCGARIRFPFAAALAMTGTVAFLGAALWLNHPIRTVVANGYFLLLTNLCGAFVGIQIEQYSRKNFCQKLEIEAREREISEEREKSDQLLANILPQSIIARLKQSKDTIADGHEQVTVLFADIAGFTSFSSRFPPDTVVSYLNEIFSRFDQSVADHQLEKIKTIGDAYMVAAGVPEPFTAGAEAIARLALEMIATANELHSRDARDLQLRIGIHTGPVVAGIIGATKLNYDVWGDTVNTASRMESHCEPGRIQVSEATFALLEPEFTLEARGQIDVKGKGMMQTWWLTGEQKQAT